MKLKNPPKKVVKPSEPKTPRVMHRLDQDNYDPAFQISLKEIVSRVVALAQAIAERKFYDYQVELAYRVVESLLDHDGSVVTSLMARQVGKTEVIGAIVAAIAIVLPELAKIFPKDWKLNITDDRGAYRGFAHGVNIGIYAPRLDQAAIMFDRVKRSLETNTATQVLREMRLKLEVSNGNEVCISSGSRILCESASEQSKIEGATHHLLIVEECQDVGDLKIKKSLHPMVASTMGTIVKIGTATTQRCNFYDSIKTNQRMELMTGKQNHFFYPYTVAVSYNSLYAKYIEQEKIRLGEDSDEFRTSYCCEWIFERGMFITQDQLFHSGVALINGLFSTFHLKGLPQQTHSNFSIVASIDWASSHDSTVVTLVAVNWNAPMDSGFFTDERGEQSFTYFRKHVIGWLDFTGDNYESQFEEIYSFLVNFPGLTTIVMDSNAAGRPLFDRFCSVFSGRKVKVVPFNFQAKLKSDGYKSLYSDICSKRITFPASRSIRFDLRYRKFVNQMLDLRKEYRNGNMQVAHPDMKGAHDDYPDSLMMACWAANEPLYANGIDVVEGNLFR